MIPYVDFTYFLLLLYPLSALVVLGVLGRVGRSVVLAVSVAVVLFQYGAPLGGADRSAGLQQLILLGGYAAGGAVIARAYSFALRRHAGQSAFYVAIGLVLLPVVATKVYALTVASGLVHASAPPGGTGPHAPPPLGMPPAAAGLWDTFGFVGLSYVSLRAVDVIIALHDGVLKEAPGVLDLVSYLLFVPTISAGPIDRFQRFAKNLDALPLRGQDYRREVEAGIHRIAQGFLYKFIIASLIYRHALIPLARHSGILAVVGYMYAYSLYLFFDFAGYSAFAIGVGHFFGIHVPENFNAPFLSRNFREMWDRWHISLSWWLRDHVYMRFMLNATRRRWFGGNRERAHWVALMLTMSLMGCWHGLEPQYVVYGVYQGLMLVAYDVVGRWNKRRRLVGDSRLAHVAGVFVTVNLFCFGLLIFSGRLFAAKPPVDRGDRRHPASVAAAADSSWPAQMVEDLADHPRLVDGGIG